MCCRRGIPAFRPASPYPACIRTTVCFRRIVRRFPRASFLYLSDEIKLTVSYFIFYRFSSGVHARLSTD